MNSMSLSTSSPVVPLPPFPAIRPRHVRVLLVDDHPVVRRGLAAVLSRRPWISIIGESADGADALRQARELKPDIILMDIDMPQMSGLDATELLRRQLPFVKVIILSMHCGPDYVSRIMRSGAKGYLLKDAPPEEVILAIETVAAAKAYFSPEIARLALNQFVRGSARSALELLTTREREVLVQIAEGLSNKEIAQQLAVGVRTVETHRERIMRKVGIHSVAGLTKFALAQGLIRMPEMAGS